MNSDDYESADLLVNSSSNNYEGLKMFPSMILNLDASQDMYIFFNGKQYKVNKEKLVNTLQQFDVLEWING